RGGTASGAQMVTTLRRPYDPIDLSSFAFWRSTARERDVAFAELRRERPVSWHRPVEDGAGNRYSEGGFWAVVRHADVEAGLRDPATFRSAPSIFYEDVPDAAKTAMSFINMDAPRHTQLRRLVSLAFTPKSIHGLEVPLRAEAARIVDRLLTDGPGDFVQQVSAPLPSFAISEMLGIAEERRGWFAEVSEDFANWNDPAKLAKYGVGSGGEVMLATVALLSEAMHDLARERRRHPGDDLMSRLVAADVDGERLSDGEIANFASLLIVAGNDTTRQTLSHGLAALSEFPEQKKLLLDHFAAHADTMTDEMLRWATIGMGVRRTAADDTSIAGVPIRAGEKVVFFLISANRDETVFPGPWRFDITRDPNPHLAMGAGPHYCLGVQVARLELRVLWEELLRRVPQIEAESVEYAIGNHMHAVRSLPCRF
ncbi:MAG: cytochrome P450, partial [Acidimicrobiia bacterium]